MEGFEMGNVGNYIDAAQLVLYVFWFFFAGLIIYLHAENKREGYPLESDRWNDRVKVVGFPAVPKPKTYRYLDGSTVSVPGDNIEEAPIAAEPSAPWPGAPLVPTGDPMVDGVGPAAYALREEHPDHAYDMAPRIAPLRSLPDFGLAARDIDPRGFDVVGLDDEVGGKVVDVWIDRSDPQVRYLEVEVAQAGGEARRTLLPINFAHVTKRSQKVKTRAVKGEHFARAPGLASPDVVTMREEDQISAYFASGFLYATPKRSAPLV